MRRMIHYTRDGFIKGSTKIYENDKSKITNLLAWLICIIGIVIILKISGLINIIDIIITFGNYLK